MFLVLGGRLRRRQVFSRPSLRSGLAFNNTELELYKQGFSRHKHRAKYMEEYQIFKESL